MKFKICGRKHIENGMIELCTIIEIIINKTLCKTLNGSSVYPKSDIIVMMMLRLLKVL